MAYDQKTRLAVRAAYIYKCLDVKDSARVCNIPYATARAWKKAAAEKGDDWDSARNASRMVHGGGMTELTNNMLEQFALHSESLFGEIRDDTDMKPGTKVEIMYKLQDAYSKLVASSAKSGTKIAPLAVAMNVLKLLTEFIKEQHPEHANIFMEILEPFGHKVAEEMG